MVAVPQLVLHNPGRRNEAEAAHGDQGGGEEHPEASHTVEHGGSLGQKARRQTQIDPEPGCFFFFLLPAQERMHLELTPSGSGTSTSAKRPHQHRKSSAETKNNNPVFGCAWVQNIWSGPTVHRCPGHISGGSAGSGSCGGGGGDALKSQVTLPSSAPRRLEPCSNLPSELARCLSTDSQQVDEQFDIRSTSTDSSRKQTGSLRSSLLGSALVRRQSQLRQQQQLRASVSGARLSHDKPPVSKVLLPVEPVRVKPRRNPLLYIISSSQRGVK